MALGATPAEMRGMVLRRGLSIGAVGASAGIGGGLLMNDSISGLLFEVSPADPLTLGITAALILGAALIASFVPARSSMAIDPGVALRSEG
jgi:ABC-type antimicrobial peptide transport system permease subunit